MNKHSVRGEVDPMLIIVIVCVVVFAVLLGFTGKHQGYINHSKQLHAKAYKAEGDAAMLQMIVIWGCFTDPNQFAAAQAASARATTAETEAESYDSAEGLSAAEIEVAESQAESSAAEVPETTGESAEAAESSGAESAEAAAD